MLVDIEVALEYTVEIQLREFRRAQRITTINVDDEFIQEVVNKAIKMALDQGYSRYDISIITNYFNDILQDYLEDDIEIYIDADDLANSANADGDYDLDDRDITSEVFEDCDDVTLSELPPFDASFIDVIISDMDTPDHKEPGEYHRGCSCSNCRNHTVYLYRSGDLGLDEIDTESLRDELRKENTDQESLDEEVLMTDDEEEEKPRRVLGQIYDKQMEQNDFLNSL